MSSQEQSAKKKELKRKERRCIDLILKSQYDENIEREKSLDEMKHIIEKKDRDKKNTKNSDGRKINRRIQKIKRYPTKREKIIENEIKQCNVGFGYISSIE